MKFTLKGGGQVVGETAKEIVEKLRELSFTPGRNNQDYMDLVSKNCYVYDMSIIRSDDYDEFIQDLIKNGYLK